VFLSTSPPLSPSPSKERGRVCKRGFAPLKLPVIYLGASPLFDSPLVCPFKERGEVTFEGALLLQSTLINDLSG